MKTFTAIAVPTAIVAALGAWSLSAQAASDQSTAPPGEYMAPGLSVPGMDPARGKKLFASKGCVVCHSINGLGGEDAPKLDASTMQPVMNPFDFFAKMWRGAAPMIMMQQDEIGHQIEFTGQDLADIVAFVHNPAMQKTFTEDDIPPEIASQSDRLRFTPISTALTQSLSRCAAGLRVHIGTQGSDTLRIWCKKGDLKPSVAFLGHF